MDSWLGPGIEPSEVERRSILSRLTSCSVTSSNAEGALSTRTALVEQVGPGGRVLTVRLLGSSVCDDIIPNPRITITARPAIGPHELVAVNGLARIQSRTTAGNGRELLLLDVAIQRMECWGSAPPAAAPRPVPASADEHVAPRVRHDVMTRKQA